MRDTSRGRRARMGRALVAKAVCHRCWPRPRRCCHGSLPPYSSSIPPPQLYRMGWVVVQQQQGAREGGAVPSRTLRKWGGRAAKAICEAEPPSPGPSERQRLASAADEQRRAWATELAQRISKDERPPSCHCTKTRQVGPGGREECRSSNARLL